MITSSDIKKINNADKLSMEQLYNLKKRLVQDMVSIGSMLDSKIIDKWGFHYSETDDDGMIDTLDYGSQGLSFKGFCNTMDEYEGAKQ